jgi:type I pantothenate kinase
MTRIGYSSLTFVDFSIYVDAPEDLLQGWYINRFLKFRQGAFSDPDSYFHHYAKLPEAEAVNIATQLWNEINGLNLTGKYPSNDASGRA